MFESVYFLCLKNDLFLYMILLKSLFEIIAFVYHLLILFNWIIIIVNKRGLLIICKSEALFRTVLQRMNNLVIFEDTLIRFVSEFIVNKRGVFISLPIHVTLDILVVHYREAHATLDILVCYREGCWSEALFRAVLHSLPIHATLDIIVCYREVCWSEVLISGVLQRINNLVIFEDTLIRLVFILECFEMNFFLNRLLEMLLIHQFPKLRKLPRLLSCLLSH